MTIVNVREGTVPEPKGDKDMEKGAHKDPIKEIQEAAYDGERLRAFKRAAGLDEPHPSSAVKAEETTKVDLAAIFNSQNQLVKDSYAQLQAMQTQSQTSKDDPFLTFLLEEFKAMRQRMEGPAPDPLATIVQQAEHMKILAQTMKEHLGIPSGVQVGSADMPHLLELERMKQEGEEKKRQWETERDERNKQWARENQQWLEEFKLKRLQFAEDHQTRGKAVAALEDLAGSLINGIDSERGETSGSPGQVRKPRSFRCSGCGAVVRVKSPKSTDALCEGCGSWFDLVVQDAPEAARD